MTPFQQVTPLTKPSQPRRVSIEETSSDQDMTSQQQQQQQQVETLPLHHEQDETRTAKICWDVDLTAGIALDDVQQPQPPPPLPSAAKKRRISFDTIEIIELPIILGDHPCVEDGPPLSVSWKPQLRLSVSLDRFETARENFRRPFPCRISKCTRQKVLARHGVCQRDMDRAAIEAKKIKLERFFSLLPWSNAAADDDGSWGPSEKSC